VDRHHSDQKSENRQKITKIQPKKIKLALIMTETQKINISMNIKNQETLQCEKL